MSTGDRLAKARPELTYEFAWQTDTECQQFAFDHLVSDRVRGWCNALAAETRSIPWMLKSLPADDARVAELTRRWARASGTGRN